MKKDTILKISSLLGFQTTGNEQDWAIEFADKNRIQEFINVLKSYDFEYDDRIAIISLILASYDDLLSDSIDKNDDFWERIIECMNLHKKDYEDILNYWAIWNEKESNNLFNITLLVRNYIIQTLRF